MRFNIIRLGINLCEVISLLICLTGCTGNIAQRTFVVTPIPLQTSSLTEEAFDKIALSSGYYATHAKDIGEVQDSEDLGKLTLILDYKRPDNPSLALYVLRDMKGNLLVKIEDSDLPPLHGALCKDYMELVKKTQKQIGFDHVTSVYDGPNGDCFGKE